MTEVGRDLGVPTPTSCWKQGQLPEQPVCPGALSSRILNTSKGADCTTSLGNWCLTVLMVSQFLLRHRLNLSPFFMPIDLLPPHTL